MLLQPGSEDELDDLIAQIRRGEPVVHARSLRMRKDGTRIDASVTMSPIYDTDGTLVGVSAIARDISPLLAAQREIEDGARRREQFLAMLSHELRNPLAAVMNASVLLRTVGEGSARDRAQAVIERQAAHMQRLLDDLLDISRITRGKFELRTAAVDLRRPIEAAIESTAPLYAERGVRLVHDIADVAMPLRGDASRLMQMVVNLLSNAANYSPRRSTVRLDVTVEDATATICVTDHGVGIDHSMQEKIFELFVQAEQRLDRSRGGLGVGLSLARSIVELHGGTISVHSDGAGKGSRFTVTVPLGDPAAADIADRIGPRVVTPRRIVLVDDQDDSREMLRMLLEARDHVVLDAADGPTAIELIEREKPDIAFIDIGLPTMTGYEVAQQIRARAELRGVRLVALTGYGNPSDVAMAREAGFDEHVIKPAALARIEQILAGN
jgi:two-component system, chemotaxis family, CheB/CheR fusion protein